MFSSNTFGSRRISGTSIGSSSALLDPASPLGRLSKRNRVARQIGKAASSVFEKLEDRQMLTTLAVDFSPERVSATWFRLNPAITVDGNLIDPNSPTITTALLWESGGSGPYELYRGGDQWYGIIPYGLSSEFKIVVEYLDVYNGEAPYDRYWASSGWKTVDAYKVGGHLKRLTAVPGDTSLNKPTEMWVEWEGDELYSWDWTGYHVQIHEYDPFNNFVSTTSVDVSNFNSGSRGTGMYHFFTSSQNHTYHFDVTPYVNSPLYSEGNLIEFEVESPLMNVSMPFVPIEIPSRGNIPSMMDTVNNWLLQNNWPASLDQYPRFRIERKILDQDLNPFGEPRTPWVLEQFDVPEGLQFPLFDSILNTPLPASGGFLRYDVYLDMEMTQGSASYFLGSQDVDIPTVTVEAPTVSFNATSSAVTISESITDPAYSSNQVKYSIWRRDITAGETDQQYTIVQNASPFSNGSEIQFSDTAVTPGNTYGYIVYAEVSDGTSSFLTSVTNETQVTVPEPPAPLILASVTTPEGVMVSGTFTDQGYGYYGDWYDIIRKDETLYQTTWSLVATLPRQPYTSLTWTDSNVEVGHSYTYAVCPTGFDYDAYASSQQTITPATVNITWTAVEGVPNSFYGSVSISGYYSENVRLSITAVSPWTISWDGSMFGSTIDVWTCSGGISSYQYGSNMPVWFQNSDPNSTLDIATLNAIMLNGMISLMW